MSANNLKFFDFEVFPQWWCCVVSDEEDEYPGGPYNNKFTETDEKRIKDKMRVYTSDGDLVRVRESLKADLKTKVLSGYNIKRYDLIIAKCIFAGFTPQKLYIANQILIGAEAPDLDAEHVRIAEFIRFGWNEAEAWQDLMDDSDKGLKDKECSLGMDIRETTVPFGKIDLTESDKEEIIYYCKHDVYALHVFYVTMSKAYIDTKVQLCDTFGLTRKIAYTNTNANLASKVLEAQRVHGTTITDPTIVIRDQRLREYLEKWLPKEIYNHLLTKQEPKTFELYDNIVDIADGGLHSVYKVPKIGKETPALYVESTDEWTMFNVDVSSCYPSVMIFCHAMSRAIKKPERLTYIFKRRLELKLIPKSKWSAEDKAFVPAAKLVLNTTYGAMGNKYLPLYDDYMRSKVCRVGQMILISISNELYNCIPDLKVIQTNTDGVLVYARRKYYDKIKSIVDNFSAISQFSFEIEEDNKLWQLNVNNYIAIHPDGDVKQKGGAFVTTVYQKGTNKLRPLSTYCIPKAQMAWLIDKKNPVQELLNNTDVSDFCLTCTKGPTYKGMKQYMNGHEIELGKVARVIAVTNEEFGAIKKYKFMKADGTMKEDSVALCPPHPLVVNDNLANYKIENGILYNIVTSESWKIDYAYYARELDRALSISWFKLKNDEACFTHEFDL